MHSIAEIIQSIHRAQILISILPIFILFLYFSQITFGDSCINFNNDERLIVITCAHADLPLIETEVNDTNILSRESPKNKNWLLNAGMVIEKNSLLNINSSTADWLKVIPTQVTTINKTKVNNIDNPNGIHVYGSLNIDSVKITSWDPAMGEVIPFKFGKRPGEEHTKTDYDTAEPRVFIRVSKTATGTTNIIDSELAYMGYSCSRCAGLSYYGGTGSIIQGSEIHHLLKGFYSKNMKFMTIEGNRFHDNYLYGIDPHTGTRDMVIRNNIVYGNNASGIICAKDCHNILVEGNEVYKNGGVGRGIAFTINTTSSTARNNIVSDQPRCVSFSKESNYNEVYNNTLSNCEIGVYVGDASNNYVHNNKIVNSDTGITLRNTTNRISDNEIIDSKYGITVFKPHNSTLDYENVDNIMKNVSKEILFKEIKIKKPANQTNEQNNITTASAIASLS